MARHVLPNAKCIHCDGPSLFYTYSFTVLLRKRYENCYLSQVELTPASELFNTGWKLAFKTITLPPTGLYDCLLAPWVISSIWTARNYKIFQKRLFTAQEVMTKTIKEAKEWKWAQVKEVPPTQIPVRSKQPTGQEVICRSDAVWDKERSTTTDSPNIEMRDSSLTVII